MATFVSLRRRESAPSLVLLIFLEATAAQQRQIAIFWLIVLALLGAVIFGLVWSASRRRSLFVTRLERLRAVAGHTLTLTDIAAADIEEALHSGVRMDTDMRREYEKALALQDRSRADTDSTSSAEALVQANQHAAQAVLALQGIIRRLDIRSQLADSREILAPRCFYCAREDRAPYAERVIEDGHSNSIVVYVCSLCQAQLARGRTPQLATARFSPTTVPWYAIPDQPWYCAYGGPSWPYWLPFVVGMDIGSWLDGGWAYATSWRDPAVFASDGATDQLPTPEHRPAARAGGTEDSSSRAAE